MSGLKAIKPEWPGLADLGRQGPKGIYCRGEAGEDFFAESAAVIGSRQMTDYGRRVVAEKLVPKLVAEGKTIVSGFMYGVDQTAHRAALECGGKTAAVLGWGIEWKMTPGDEKLAKDIVHGGGVVISEWKDQVPALWTFPQRNRIVAALSREIYVVEAAGRSGALITTDWGRKLGRKIWAVPGPVTSRVSVGTNRLLATGEAQAWIPDQEISGKDAKKSSNDTEIYSLLQNEALTADELARKLKRPVEEVGAKLTIMLLAGEVEEKTGRYYNR